MVVLWGLSLFLAGLAIVAVELGYPRRYVGVVGIVLADVGLAAMFLPPGMPSVSRALVLAAVGALTAAIAIPFYRRWAPAVGPMAAPTVTAGDMATVVEPIRPERPGLVRAGGIVWTARADRPAAAGEAVRILVVEQDTLWVEPDLVAPAQEGERAQDAEHEGRR